MKTSEAKELFLHMTENFFPNHNVVWANQSRMQKSRLPLIVLTAGNVRRPNFPNTDSDDDGILYGRYESHVPITVDLFSHGTPILDKNDKVLAYEDTAMDELLTFVDYMNSAMCTNWCYVNDISLLIEEDAQNLSGVINDTNYEYRARQVVDLSFTQTMTEDMGAMTDVDIESRWN